VTFALRNRLRLAAPVLVLGLAVPAAAQAWIQPAAASGFASSAVASTSTVQPGAESQLLALTNSSRSGAGLGALSSSSVLVSLARGWSAHMASVHALSHNPNLAGAVGGWYSLGENVAMAGSAAQAQSLFMGSPEHRANILDRLYNRVGVGIVRAADGTLWITVDFEQTAGYTPSPVPVATHRPAAAAARPSQARAPASAADVLLAERRAAAARASRSLRRQPVTAASVVAPADPRALSSRLRSQDGGDQAAAQQPPVLAFGPGGLAGSDSPVALLWLAGLAVVFVLAGVVGQRLGSQAGRSRATNCSSWATVRHSTMSITSA